MASERADREAFNLLRDVTSDPTVKIKAAGLAKHLAAFWDRAQREALEEAERAVLRERWVSAAAKSVQSRIAAAVRALAPEPHKAADAGAEGEG